MTMALVRVVGGTKFARKDIVDIPIAFLLHPYEENVVMVILD